MKIDLRTDIQPAIEQTEQVRERVLREFGAGIETSGKMLAKVSRRHLRVGRKINKQDSGTGAARQTSDKNPVSLAVDLSALRATVGIASHWEQVRVGGNSTTVRPDIEAMLAMDEYTRTDLIIEREMFRHAIRQPAKTFAISDAWGGKLLEWANRDDKGMQALRHVVQVARAEALERLAMDPAVREVQPVIQRLLTAAVVRGMEGS